MATKSVKEVRDGLVTVLRKLNPGFGFSFNLPPDNIKVKYTEEEVRRVTPDITYPKCFVCILAGTNRRLVGGREGRGVSLSVIFVMKQTPGYPDDPGEQTLTLVEDMHKLMLQNESLAGTVNNSQIDRWTVDGGAVRPEGVAIFEISTSREAN